MKNLFLFLLAAFALTSASHSSEFKPSSLPAYAENHAFVAIGSDGFLYAAASNSNGYVFKSLLEQYRFVPTGNGFAGDILAGRKVFYLGASCDAASDDLTGSWTKSGTGLDFVIEAQNGARISFRLLSTGLSPSHSC